MEWKAPMAGWIKLNSDGASSRKPSRAGYGNLLRNENGRWECGCSYNIGTCLAFKAKLWGIFMGLQLAWHKGYGN